MIPTIAVRLATRFPLRRGQQQQPAAALWRCIISSSSSSSSPPHHQPYLALRRRAYYCRVSTVRTSSATATTAWMRDGRTKEKEPSSSAPLGMKVSLPPAAKRQPQKQHRQPSKTTFIKKQHYSIERGRLEEDGGDHHHHHHHPVVGGDEQQQQYYSKAEQALRYDLAVAHRLTALHGMDMLVWNHISARLPPSSKDGAGCLITPGRKLWSQIAPSDLVRTSANVTANVIHDAIYAARPEEEDVQAVIHLHTPHATAVSCLAQGFVPLTQDAAYFYNKVAHYQWDGLSNDAAEGPAIQEAIRSVPGCNTLLMNNHGFACFGSSVREVWVLAYYFERVCEIQMNLLQCGGGAQINMPPKAVMEKAAADSYLPDFAPGVCEWEALCQQVSFDT